MKLSIVVPAFNEEKLLPVTLPKIKKAAEALRAAATEVEFILCDNNSTDRTGEIARAHGFNVIFEPVNQIGRARNAGASIATGDWLLFIDADSAPSPELLLETQRVIISGNAIAGGSTVCLDEPNLFLGVFVSVWNAISRLKHWFAGSYIFCRVDLFRELGGFSPNLYASEELDLSERFKKRARELGKKVVIISKYPLSTSARKAHLYTAGEHLRFFLKALLRPRKVLGAREACSIWYDGRR